MLILMWRVEVLTARRRSIWSAVIKRQTVAHDEGSRQSNDGKPTWLYKHLRSRTYRLIGFQDSTRPGLPAGEDQLRAVEEAFHCTLAPSYRHFLSINNGWQFWSCDQALLSTDQMLAGEYAHIIQEWKKRERRLGRRSSDDYLVIGLSLFDDEKLLMDISSSTNEIMFWEYRELRRYPDFQDYLEDFEAILNEELATDLWSENVAQFDRRGTSLTVAGARGYMYTAPMPSPEGQ